MSDSEDKDLNITLYKKQLPSTPEELQHYIAIGETVLNMEKERIKGIKKLNKANADFEAALKDLQAAGEILLWAKVTLGEFTMTLPKRPGTRTDLGQPHLTKEGRLEQLNITIPECEEYETLAKDQTTVALEIEIAKEEERAPSPQKAVELIRKKREILRFPEDIFPEYSEEKEIAMKVRDICNKGWWLNCDAQELIQHVEDTVAKKGKEYTKLFPLYETLKGVFE